VFPEGSPKTLLVLGLARSGVAAAQLALREGWRVFVTDDRDVEAPALPHAARRLDRDEAVARVVESNMVVPSPGIPASHPVLAAARRAGVAVVPEIEFAADRLHATLLAVTGTNGKSTTVSLLGAICEAAGKNTFTGGNLGDPLCNAVGVDHDFVVAEVSSFQLEHATTFHPHVAAMLNFSPDHLDRHGDVEGYLQAKLRLFARLTGSDFAVVAEGEDWAERVAASTQARVSVFGWSRGDAPPSREGTFIDAEARLLRGPGGFEVRLAPGAWPELPHDLENAAAAAEIARVVGVPATAVAAAISAFRPLRHRLAKVGEKDGVTFWNDSKATNVGAALSSLRAFDGRVLLLAGGVSKGCDFAALAREASRFTLVVAYGEAAAEIEAALAPAIRVVRESGLRDALSRAAHEARPGEAVLLAPACASFDEFRDYAHRGESFEQWVRQLVEEVGA
jgi:UDP-N-acetylmuramoylalanine--D-glutamate ligase